MTAEIDPIKAAGMTNTGSPGLNTIIRLKAIRTKNFRIWLNIFQKTTFTISSNTILNTPTIMPLFAGELQLGFGINSLIP
jgi:hypothetical protein